MRSIRNIYSKYVKGFRSDRKIVVIESDDWGSIRVPSIEVRDKLISEYPRVSYDPYMRVDTLESDEDLMMLFKLLRKFSDKNGRTPIITANVLMGNPDFDKIRLSNFTEYFQQSVSETFNEYYGNTRLTELWKLGYDDQLFYPQYHGREHLNVDQWMNALRSGDPYVCKAFNYRMISISGFQQKLKFDFMESLDFFSVKEKNSKYEITKQGLEQFEELFGFKSRSFIANCYVWDSNLESVLKSCGIDYLQGNLYQLCPILDEIVGHRLDFKMHYLGERNEYNQIFLIRNAHFEPAFSTNMNCVENVLAQIKYAFLFKKPVILSTHRLNYVSGIDESNRNSSLSQLECLLGEILEKWPDVEFMSSVELGDFINGENQF